MKAVILLPLLLTIVVPMATTEYFAEDGIDQPFLFLNSPEAVYFNGFTYVAYQGQTGFVPIVKRFDHATNTWSQPSVVSNVNPIAGDGHGAPAIAITPNGMIHVFYGAHESALKYARGDVATFGTWTAMADPDPDATYPHAAVVGSSIYLGFRAGGLCAAWAFRISTDSGSTWSTAGQFLDTDLQAYVGPMEVRSGNIHFQWTKLLVCGGPGERSGAWAAYYNTGDNGLYCNAGTRVGFVLTQVLADAFCRIEQTPTYANFGTVHVSSGGTVYAQYLSGSAWPTGNWDIRFARLTGVGDTYLGKLSNCYALRSDEFFPASQGCDGNTATSWQDSAAAFPPSWIVTNLTAERVLKRVAINFPAFPGVSGGTIQYQDSSGNWVSDGTFTIANCNSGSPENVTATLTTPARTSAYRLLFTADGCASYVTVAETWPFGSTGEWTVQTIVTADHFQDYSDFRLPTDTTAESFVPTNAIVSGEEGGNMDRYTWDGTSWTLAGRILSVADSGAPLTAPTLPVNWVEPIRVVFDQRIISLTSAQSRLYAWGADGFKGLPIPKPPSDRTLRVVVACSYSSFVHVWNCIDRTNYTGWDDAVFERMRYQYDGVEVAATTQRGATVAFEVYDPPWSSGSRHILVVTWTMQNGGTPSSTWILQTDNRPTQVTLVFIGSVVLLAVIAAILRRGSGKIAFEPMPNPSYRNWPSEEYPKGWRTYRRTPHDPNRPTRIERQGKDRLIVYQLRDATPAEQQRTGRRRVAYIQAIRERMP